MSDPKNDVLGGLGDLDWENALDEWEKTSFSPDVAKEPAAEAKPVAESGFPTSPPVVFTPEDVLPDPQRTVPPPPPSSRGGLGQLFPRKADLAPIVDRESGSTEVADPTFADAVEPSRAEAFPAPAEDAIEPSRAEALPAASDEISSVTLQRASPSLTPPSPVLPHEERESERTLVRASSPQRASMSDADTATRLPATEGEPAIGRPSAALPPAPHTAPNLQQGTAARLLETRALTVFQARIAWLEDEARELPDPAARARALLALSELCAVSGETDRALAFAVEARDTAPDLPLAWRQARQLMDRDPDVLVEALDAEAARSPTPASRVHATLLAADLLRLHGHGDAAVERWDSACKLDPADTRAPIARAALALAQNDHASGFLQLADNSELVPFAKAIATVLRLRGVERAGADVHEMPINDGLRRARAALAAGDIVAASQATAAIAATPEIARGSLWLSASLGASHIQSRRASARSFKTLATDGDELARRPLAARGIELGDPELVASALAAEDAFTPAERAILHVLSTKGALEIAPELDDPALAPLADALAALSPHAFENGRDDAMDPAIIHRRAGRVSGKLDARALATVGRLLAADADDVVVEHALDQVGEASPAAAGVAIESAVRAKRWGELSDALSALPSTDETTEAQRHIAAAIVAERAENRERAQAAWKAAAFAPTHGTEGDGLLRIAAALDPVIDLGGELLGLAEQMPDGTASGVLRLEALTRGAITEDDQAVHLDRIHRAAPALGIASFLAERIGRRKGDLEEVLRWIHERRTYITDPLETALDAVREALLVADRDPEVAGNRLEEAHRARPTDVALRDLYERLAPEPPTDRGTWREMRASAAKTPDAAAVLWLEAALEHERNGDAPSALRASRRAADAGDTGLAGPLVERTELWTGDTTRQTDELMELTKTTEDVAVRRAAFERLAALDAFAKNDLSAANMWHRAILEDTPQHKPSLRWLEHALLGQGRDEELGAIFEQIALALDGSTGGEVTAHAQHAARLIARDTATGGSQQAWDRTYEMAQLAATQPEPSLWALRSLNAHARIRQEDDATLKTTLALLERTQRPAERASLLLRASESAARLEQTADARRYLEQAAAEDPGDVVAWGFLAEVRAAAGETRAAAEACESLARTSMVPEHRLLAWHDAAKIWLEEVHDLDRAMTALEAASEIDPAYADVFPRLSAIYADKNLESELAALLERRLGTVEDAEERVALEVELARAFAGMGELGKAKAVLASALETRPDHSTALAAMAGLCTKEGDWAGAEQAYVRLVRGSSDPAEQRAIYEQLGEIYATHAPNLARAEVAFREVLKRAPGDVPTLRRLVDVLRRAGDVAKAAIAQQEIVSAAIDPGARLEGLLSLAEIHETVGRDPRRSEQVLDGARKEFPTSVVALRAMAEFYARQKQMPAMQILLDRAAGDARRAFAQGRFVPALFEVLHAAFELRGKRDAARVVAATLAAVEGDASDLTGGDARAIDPRLDELLAPEAMSNALRTVFLQTGDTLDVVAPVDLRALSAAPLPPGSRAAALIGGVATVVGLGALQILVSPALGKVALPLSSNPPTLLVGESLAQTDNERAVVFVVTRALKMLLAHASALIRVPASEVAPLVAGLFGAFNPNFTPPGVDARRVSDYARRIAPALPRNIDPTIGVIALEAAGMVGQNWSSLAGAASSWANRVALLAVGDPSAALDAIAWEKNEEAAPRESEERAAWIARHAEARDLMTFSVTDTYAEARSRLGLDR